MGGTSIRARELSWLVGPRDRLIETDRNGLFESPIWVDPLDMPLVPFCADCGVGHALVLYSWPGAQIVLYSQRIGTVLLSTIVFSLEHNSFDTCGQPGRMQFSEREWAKLCQVG
jgi:hypothetical protein